MAIELRALGKQWGRLIDDRYLEVGRHGDQLYFDLHETVRLGRPVVVRVLPPDDEDELTSGQNVRAVVD